MFFFFLLSLYAQHKLTLNDDEMFLGDRSLTALAAPDHILLEQWPHDRLLYLAITAPDHILREQWPRDRLL